MARHRDIRNMDVDEVYTRKKEHNKNGRSSDGQSFSERDYDDDDDYDYHCSIDDETNLSRSLKETYLYSARNKQNLEGYFDSAEGKGAKEEEESSYYDHDDDDALFEFDDDSFAPSKKTASKTKSQPGQKPAKKGKMQPKNSQTSKTPASSSAVQDSLTPQIVPEDVAKRLEEKKNPELSSQTVGKLSRSGKSSRRESLSPPRAQTPLSKNSSRFASPNSNANSPSVLRIRARKRPSGAKDLLNLVVIGHVDAGKSTMMGHLLFQLGNVSQKAMHKFRSESERAGKASFAYAWVLDEGAEERARGVTMDIARNRFETDTKQVVLLDAPGHKDFIPNMINGATQADAAVLVANASTGEFETGFDLGGQTREHAMLVRSLGVTQLAVAVNKLDTVGWAQGRFDDVRDKMKLFLKQTGFTDVIFVPVCGLTGDNLTKPPPSEHPFSKWYHGPTLLQVIDQLKPPVRNTDKPLRLCVSNVYKGQTGGVTIEGKVETGSVEVGDKVIIMPNGDLAQVKTAQGEEGLDSQTAYAGDHCLVTLAGTFDPSTIGAGHVICHTDAPIAPVTRFQARLVLFNTVEVPITAGFPVVLHAQNLNAPARVSKLLTQLNKSTGEVDRKKPRCLSKNTSGVVEITTERPICLDTSTEFKELGRITLRYNGKTIAAGLVEKLLS